MTWWRIVILFVVLLIAGCTVTPRAGWEAPLPWGDAASGPLQTELCAFAADPAYYLDNDFRSPAVAIGVTAPKVDEWRLGVGTVVPTGDPSRARPAFSLFNRQYGLWWCISPHQPAFGVAITVTRWEVSK